MRLPEEAEALANDERPDDGRIGVRGRPDPGALRRTGKAFKMLLPDEEHDAAVRDAKDKPRTYRVRVFGPAHFGRV